MVTLQDSAYVAEHTALYSAMSVRLRIPSIGQSIYWCVSCTADILAEAEIIKQESLVNSLPMDRLQMLAQDLQGGPNN